MTSDEALAWSLRALDEAREAGAALAAEVRRLRGELQDERLSLAPLREAHAEALNAAAQNEAALAALRQRHAAAVEAWGCYYKDKLFAVSLDEASARHDFHDVRPVLIVASKAKARLT
jgi:hypothetical protein